MARLMLNLQARAEGGRDFLTTINSGSDPQSTTMIFSSRIGAPESGMSGTTTTMFHGTGKFGADSTGEMPEWGPSSPISPNLEEMELRDVMEIPRNTVRDQLPI